MPEFFRTATINTAVYRSLFALSIALGSTTAGVAQEFGDPVITDQPGPASQPLQPGPVDQALQPGATRQGPATAIAPTQQPPQPQSLQQPSAFNELNLGDTRTRGTLASSRQSSFGRSFSSQPTLARANSMIGDLFGRAASLSTIAELSGIAVHHPLGGGAPFGDNDIHFVELTPDGSAAVFVGGPAGLVPGSFLIPSIAPPVPSVVEGLTANQLPGQTFTVIATNNTIDVLDNPMATSPSIPDAQVFNVFGTTQLLIPGPNVSDLVGRGRIADNNSALPRDRFYVDYKYFHNVPLTASGTDVNRLVAGVEKTFWSGLGSVEFRIPMALTLSSGISSATTPDTSQYELGNALVIPKLLLTSTDQLALAAGMGVTVPTADDLSVLGASGDPLLRIDNDAVHLIPFVAWLVSPRYSRFYYHGFLTVDIDANGSSVDANFSTPGSGLQNIGTWRDQNLLSAHGSVGTYICQCNSPRSHLQGIAVTAELHYTATLNDADTVTSGPFRIGDPERDLSLLNGTVGSHFCFRDATLTAAYAFPITSDDRVFDGEFRLFFNRFF